MKTLNDYILEGFDRPKPLKFDVDSSVDYWSIDRLNFHTLADFHRDPKLFKAGFFKDKEPTPAMMFGSALHCKLLQPKEFGDKYALFDPPINPKTGEAFGASTKTYAEALAACAKENAGKSLISSAEYELINRMVDEFFFHPVAPLLFDNDNDDATEIADVEQTIIGSLSFDGTAEHAVDVKGRVDAYSSTSGLIDVKTTASLDDCTGKDRFRFAVYDYKYLPQLAFYHRILRESYGAPYVPVWLVVFEVNEPNRVAVYTPTVETLEKAYRVVDVWLEQWVDAKQRGTYASKYDDVQIIDAYIAERDY